MELYKGFIKQMHSVHQNTEFSCTSNLFLIRELLLLEAEAKDSALSSDKATRHISLLLLRNS